MTDDTKKNNDANDEFALDEDLESPEIEESLETLEDENFDEIDEDFNEDEFDVPKKSGSKSILFLLVFLLLIGGAGYYFLGKSLPFIGGNKNKTVTATANTAVPPAPVPGTSGTSSDTQQASPLPPPPMPTPIGPDTGEGGDDLTALQDITAPEPAPRMDEVAQPLIDPIEDMATDAANAITETAQEVTQAVLPDDLISLEQEVASSEEPSTTQEENLQDEVIADEIVEDETVTEEVLAPVTESTEAMSNSVADNTRIEALEETVQGLAQQIETAVNTLSSQPQMNTDNSLAEQNKEQLDTLTQQMLQVTHRLDQLGDKIDDLGKKANTQTSAPKPKPVEKSVAPAPKPSTTKAPAPTPKSTSWTLRSAQPGVAWLSQGNNTEMQRYSVGQSLSGMGTITAITQENGKWVVRTTTGVIKQ